MFFLSALRAGDQLGPCKWLIHNEALRYERCAVLRVAWVQSQIAELYLWSARYGYLRWGAVGQVRQLDERLSRPQTGRLTFRPMSTIGRRLNTSTSDVIKVSQAVSGEIVLENLIDSLMHTAMEQAGAERALLICRAARASYRGRSYDQRRYGDRTSIDEP